MKPNLENLSPLVAAVHTPFHADGSLNLAIVEKQAEHMLRNNITAVFVGGTTGEGHSLSVGERQQLAHRWSEVSRSTPLRMIVHVGSNCLSETKQLAAQAETLGALAVAAVPPSYFKPADVPALVASCREIAAAAPSTPFFYYDIPAMTHVSLPMPEFLRQAREQIPTMAGMKYTNPDLVTFQECVQLHGRDLQIFFGLDELLLPALALGARRAVGATYNFAAPIYHRVIAAFERNDLAAARTEQFRSVQLIRLLGRYGLWGATKAVMKILGVDVGPARLPNRSLTPQQCAALQKDLEALGFLDWIK